MDNMDHEQKSGNDTKLRVHFEVSQKETEPLTHHKRSSSSYSSESSIESVVIDKDINTAVELKAADVESQGHMPSLEAYSQTPTCSNQGASTAQPLQIQVAGPHGSYDPTRIPLSIFSAKPSNPMEWSVASNESLFSIHMGNNSFSRDHFILMTRSGELGMSAESNNFHASYKKELNNFPATIRPVGETVKAENKNEKMGNGSEKTEASTESMKLAVSSVTPGDHIKETLPLVEEVRSSISVSYRSDESNTSTSSFQFPVFIGDGGRSGFGTTTDSNTQQSQKGLPLPETPETTPRSTVTNWVSCIFCCTICR